jgi:6-phosphofructokinase 2
MRQVTLTRGRPFVYQERLKPQDCTMTTLAIALNPTVDISSEVPRVLPTRKMRTGNQRVHPGGGGVNVARVIAMLGGRPALLYMPGGATGTLLTEMLRELPVDLHDVPVSQMTRAAFMVFEQESGQEYRVVPDGPEITSAELAHAMDRLNAFDGEFVVASGSLPRGVSVDTYAAMAEVAAAKGQKFVLDTSGAPLIATLERARVFLVKPSLSELETIAGGKLDEAGIEKTARQLVAEGRAEHVAVTLGRDGALLAGADGVTRLPAFDVPVKSAVGAGDSFVGALVWALSQGRGIEDAFRFGMAAGAAAAITPGTELCHVDDIHALYEGRYRP